MANSLSDWHEGGLQGQNGWYAGTRTAVGDTRSEGEPRIFRVSWTIFSSSSW